MTLSHCALLLASLAPIAIASVARAQGVAPTLGPRVAVEGGIVAGELSAKGCRYGSPTSLTASR